MWTLTLTSILAFSIAGPANILENDDEKYVTTHTMCDSFSIEESKRLQHMMIKEQLPLIEEVVPAYRLRLYLMCIESVIAYDKM